MISEELEFRISQFADGTLAAEEVAALEALLAADAEARATLETYRKLDATLKQSMPLPAMDWDRLAGHLSDAVAESDRPVTIKLFTWGRVARVALAAMVLIAIGSMVLRQSKPTPTEQIVINPQNAMALAPVEEVSVSMVAASTQTAVAEIEIGPSPLAERHPMAYAAAEDIVYRAPTVVIASTAVKRQDTVPLLPF